MDKEGRLAWDVPAGKWTVLRFGHTSTGVKNAPAPASGRGLECDKLSKEGIEANFAGMMGKLIADVGRAAGKALVATHIDSWENGSQNWTARMREEFQQRRGYDLLPFLPVTDGPGGGQPGSLGAVPVGPAADGLGAGRRELRRAHGEAGPAARAAPCRSRPTAARATTCPTAAGPTSRWASSGSAAARSRPARGWPRRRTCTASGSWARRRSRRTTASAGASIRPRIKALGDRAFCEGVNRFVFHRYAMQPWLNDRPGMTMGPWGLHYERTETWWEQSRPWHEYLARCQYLLRQGRFVADICYLQPEGSPQGFQSHRRDGYD